MSLHSNVRSASDQLRVAQGNAARSSLRHGEIVTALAELTRVISRTRGVLHELDLRLREGTDPYGSPYAGVRLAEIRSAMEIAQQRLTGAANFADNAATDYEHLARKAKLTTTRVDNV